MSEAVGWVFIFLLTGAIVWVGWLQWNTYRALDRKIERLDPSLITSAGTRVEKILDAPPGSVVVPYVVANVVHMPGVNYVPAPVAAPRYDDFSPVRLVDDQMRK